LSNNGSSRLKFFLIAKFASFKDFQFKDTRVEADALYEDVKNLIPTNTTIYIATDERKKEFFKIFKEHYNVYYLDDFKDLVSSAATNCIFQDE
jgi:hypothetical protein